jgi:hypothetical protein
VTHMRGLVAMEMLALVLVGAFIGAVIVGLLH